jgi:hypothetical protein
MQDFHADQASMLQGPYGAYLDPERAREINRLIAQSARDAEWAEAAKAAKASPASRKAEKIPAPTPAPTDDPGASDLGRFLAWGLMMVGALATILALSLVNSPFTIPYFGLDTLAGQMKIAVGGAALVIVATLFQSLRR